MLGLARPSSSSRVTFATTDAAATDSTVWSALMIVRTVPRHREIVVLAVEHDAVGLESLRRELRTARGRGRGAAPRSCRARRTRCGSRGRRRSRAPSPRTRRAATSRSAGVSSFESRTPERCSSPGTTAATVTGPAHEPRPTSSIPTTTRSPALQQLPLGAQSRDTARARARTLPRHASALATARCTVVRCSACAPARASKSGPASKQHGRGASRSPSSVGERPPARVTSCAADPTARSCPCCSTRRSPRGAPPRHLVGAVAPTPDARATPTAGRSDPRRGSRAASWCASSRAPRA